MYRCETMGLKICSVCLKDIEIEESGIKYYTCSDCIEKDLIHKTQNNGHYTILKQLDDTIEETYKKLNDNRFKLHSNFYKRYLKKLLIIRSELIRYFRTYIKD